jgi:hypothetical protein
VTSFTDNPEPEMFTEYICEPKASRVALMLFAMVRSGPEEIWQKSKVSDDHPLKSNSSFASKKLSFALPLSSIPLHASFQSCLCHNE